MGAGRCITRYNEQGAKRRDNVMTVKGRIHGKTIELAEALPYADGQEVTVFVVARGPTPPYGSAAALLDVLRQPPHIDPADVDELERAIEAGKIPVSYRGVFDEDAAE